MFKLIERRLAVAAHISLLGILLIGNSCYGQVGGSYPFNFSDAGLTSGLLPAADSIYGHGAGWGDANGDGWVDLYVGTFNKNGDKPNMLFTGNHGKFSLDQQQSLKISTRATGIVFADLDNDGDLDLYVSSMPQKERIVGNKLFRNEGHGTYTDISNNNGACPLAFGGRSATVLDYDGDGLLDIVAGEDPMPGYNGSKTKSSRLFHNLGKLQFEDATQAAGIPRDIPGYGVAAADVNNDGWPDLFIAANDGGDILFINDKHGKFYEAPGSRDLFAWKGSGDANMVCGISFGDVNRDGLLDVVLGPHFKKPWLAPQPIRLFLNRGVKNGSVSFEEVTEKAGLKPLPMKAPHVELQDFDNDGWPDLYTSIVKFDGGKIYPCIAKNKGLTNGIPIFKEDAMSVNDFPTEEDKSVASKGSTDNFFKKVLKEKKIIYGAPGPTADYDNDGRMDIFIASWWPEAPSMLLHNETAGGNWLKVRVKGTNGVNAMGIGCRINIYEAGKLGDSKAFLGGQEVSEGFGYASGHAAIAHFGLGKKTLVDVEVILPHNKGKLYRKGVKANQTIVL